MIYDLFIGDRLFSSWSLRGWLMLGFLLASIALLTALLAYRNLAGTDVHGISARPVFCGEEAVFRVLLRNGEDRARYAITACCDEDRDSADLGAQGTRALELRQTCQTGGQRRLGLVVVEVRHVYQPAHLFGDGCRHPGVGVSHGHDSQTRETVEIPSADLVGRRSGGGAGRSHVPLSRHWRSRDDDAVGVRPVGEGGARPGLGPVGHVHDLATRGPSETEVLVGDCRVSTSGASCQRHGPACTGATGSGATATRSPARRSSRRLPSSTAFAIPANIVWT